MSKNRTLAALLGGALMFAGSVLPPAAPAQGRGPVTVPMLVCPFGCGPITGDTILMNQMIQSGAPVAALPQETPGYLYNVREMAGNPQRWKTTVFATEDTAIQMAAHGGKPELREYFPERAVGDFRLLYGDAWWGIGKFFVTFDPALEKPADFKGKTIAVGLRSQSDWGFYPRLLLEQAAGVNKSNATIRHLTPGAMVQQLIDGTASVVTAALGAEPRLEEWLIPGPMRQLEAVGKPLHYVGFTKDEIDTFNARYGTTFLYYEVPAGTMPRQSAPIGVAFNRGFKAAHAQFPEQVAYDLVMTVAKLGPTMRDLHGLWKIWSPDLMVHGLSDDNVHPGAKRAYVELGWWKLTEKYPPVVLPEP